MILEANGPISTGRIGQVATDPAGRQPPPLQSAKYLLSIGPCPSIFATTRRSIASNSPRGPRKSSVAALPRLLPPDPTAPSNMHALVTGGGGFLGGYIVEALSLAVTRSAASAVSVSTPCKQKALRWSAANSRRWRRSGGRLRRNRMRVPRGSATRHRPRSRSVRRRQSYRHGDAIIRCPNGGRSALHLHKQSQRCVRGA